MTQISDLPTSTAIGASDELPVREVSTPADYRLTWANIIGTPLPVALNLGGNAIDAYTERAAAQVTGSSGTYTIDLSAGRFFPVLLSSNATIAFTNVPTTGIVSFTLEIAQNATGGYSITWPTSTTFAGGTAPTPSSAANAIDTYVGYSPDQGTTWRIEQSAKGWA